MDDLKPETSAEARERMAEAINEDNYEAAREYHELSKVLENYEAECRLSKAVTEYYADKDGLNSKAQKRICAFTKEISTARSNSDKYFKSQYAELERAQRREMESFLSRISADYEEYCSATNSGIQSSMQTARILASQLQFEKAIKLRNSVMSKGRPKAELTMQREKYLRQFNAILERHQLEIDQMLNKRESEMELFNSMESAVKEETLERFLMENAANVVGIEKRFPTDGRIPHCLKLQTVKASF